MKKFLNEFVTFLKKITRKTMSYNKKDFRHLENFLKEKLNDKNVKVYHLDELDD